MVGPSLPEAFAFYPCPPSEGDRDGDPPYFSYRGPPVQDGGWGCALRAAQMLAANAIMALGRAQPRAAFERAVSLCEGERAPAHVLRLAKASRVGCRWHTPSAACHGLRTALLEASAAGGAGAAAAAFGDVCQADCGVVEVGPASPRPVLVLCPCMLSRGGPVGERGAPVLAAALGAPQCVGAIAGRRGRAYFVRLGRGGDPDAHHPALCVVLDPHRVRAEAAHGALADPAASDEFRVPPELRYKVPLRSLDGSIALGFLVRDSADARALAELGRETGLFACVRPSHGRVAAAGSKQSVGLEARRGA